MDHPMRFATNDTTLGKRVHHALSTTTLQSEWLCSGGAGSGLVEGSCPAVNGSAWGSVLSFYNWTEYVGSNATGFRWQVAPSGAYIEGPSSRYSASRPCSKHS